MANISLRGSNALNSLGKNNISLLSRVQHLVAALLIFSVLYTLTNSYGAAVSSCCPNRIYNLATAFDNSIAFIPAMIVPYSWSLIVFVASFFMVRTSHQLSLLASRLIIATLLACVIFYIYPARFSFNRPLTTDWTALGYLFLSITDKPHNQLPSLHVSYALLLGVSLWNVLQARCTAYIVAYRLILTLICSLIILSTVFTYQHHLLDIVGGFVLAGLVLLIVNKLQSVLVLRYLTIAICGFLLLAITGFFIYLKFDQALFEYVGLVIGLYWLTSFLLLAWLYQANEVTANKIYFKKNSTGQLTVATWLRFAPILLAYKMMSSLGQFYFGHKQSGAVNSLVWHLVGDDTLISATARLSSSTLTHDFSNNIPVYSDCHLIVVDVAAEIDSHFKTMSALSDESLAIKERAHITDNNEYYHYLPLLDLQPFCLADIPIIIEFFEQIDELIGEINHVDKATLQSSVTLLNFHCVMGFSRSIAMQVLYLVYCDKLTIDTYQAWIDKHYPNAHLSTSYLPESLITAISIGNKS